MTYTFNVLTADTFSPYLDALISLRLEYFKGFPYLYEGNRNDEKSYLSSYFQHPDGCIVIAKDAQNNLVGAATGCPLAADMGDPWNVTGWFRDEAKWTKEQAQPYFYIGEVMVSDKAYEQKLEAELIHRIEKDFAERHYPHSTIMTVQRDADHPQKPENYWHFENYLSDYGFNPLSICVVSHYDTLQKDGSVQNTSNLMQFWSKEKTQIKNQ